MQFENFLKSYREIVGNDLVLFLLIQWVVVLVIARWVYPINRGLRQPETVGWIIAGLLLGPSVLGYFCPDIFHAIFQPHRVGLASSDFTHALDLDRFWIAECALVFFLSITGSEFDFSHLKQKLTATFAISLSGIIVPFVLGVGVALVLHRVLGLTVDPVGFCLFVGTCLSITALPILGKIMMELNITRTKIGTLCISAGAIDDAVGWILLGVVTALVKSNFDMWVTLQIVTLTIVFALFMVFAVKPLVAPWLERKLVEDNGVLKPGVLASVFVIVFSAGAVTQALGIYALFGAFFAGAIFSSVKGFREAFKNCMEPITNALFLPLFFTYTGLKTDITSFTSPMMWALCGLVVVAAIVGKLGGCYGAARLTKFSHRESLCIGTMMNCRALMELIAANIGLSLGVLPQSVYCMLVLTALITTVMTTPLLLRFMPGTELEPYIMSSGFMTRRVKKLKRTELVSPERVPELVS